MAATQKPAGAVRRYLDALDGHRPKRGRKRTAESVERRLAQVNEAIATAAPVQRLGLIQERIDLTDELGRLKASSDLAKLEEDFIAAAKAYSEAKGISYTAWRELGVSAEVLRKAGVQRTRRKSRA